ncbi:hypothetical protein VDG1235_2876 [Verrucomicrobiia bacterium DG1235]|nr:hypothetical protein VDG1235_2876 [Verrucomicrobiae bacterium DG1235]
MNIYRYPVYGALATAAAYALDHFLAGEWTGAVLGLAVLLSLIALAWRASKWRGYRPVRYGLVGAILVTLGKLSPGAGDLLPLGVLALVAVSLWTAWPPKNPGEKPPCCQ